MKRNQGFTVVELLIVIIIIAIIAVIALPQFINAQDRGKQSQTVANMRSISNAMALYHTDKNKYPTASNITAVKDALLSGNYMAKVPTIDGWGQEFQVSSIDRTYTIWSCGKGKGANGCNLVTGEPIGEINSFESQIIITDGAFTQYPAGTQQ